MDLIRRLHQAIKNNDSEAVEAAVTAGADVDYVWGMQGTALCQAIVTGRTSTVSQLLELGCDVNGEDYDGGFPLSLAIRKRLPDIALLLIATPSCNVNALDPVTKLRPLCSAVTEGLIDVVEALVQDPRCDITLGNSIGNSALHLSLLHKQRPITRILARCQGLRFLSNLAGHAPVHLVATLGDCTSLDLLYPASRTEETLRQLHPAPVGEEEEEEESSDKRASSAPGPGIYQRELNQRVKYTGDTALHLAVREKHHQMARRLVALGAAVDVGNNSGQTALLLACAAEDLDLALRLLRKGAPAGVPGFLRLQQQQRTLLATHSRESSLTPLHIAASTNNVPMVRALCDFGADVNSCDEHGRSVLRVALLNGAGEVAMFLLDQTPQDLERSPALGGMSLLHIAGKCRSHGAHIAAQLLRRGFSLELPTRLGNLPLHEALGWENAEVVRVLLEHGADPNAPGELDAMPLTIAARMGHIQMAEMLLAAGADLNGADQEGDNHSSCDTEEEEEGDLSPVAEALQAGMVDFARYLVNAGCSLSKEKYLFRLPSAPGLHRFTSRSLPLNLDSIGSDDDDFSDEEEDGVPDVVRDNPELFAWLKDKARNPQSLVQLSLEAVRRVFRHGDPPFAQMLCLPLPEKVIAKLFYRDNV